MDKITTLQEFNADLDRRRALADACQTSGDYLYLIGKGFKRPGPVMALCIDRESDRIWRRVPKESLRPDLWEVEINDNNAQSREVKRAKEGRERRG